MAEPCFPFIPETNGVRVAVRLTPKAASERIDGVVADAQGNGVLRVAVTAEPLYERLTNWATGQFPWPQGKKDGTKR